MAKSRPEQVRLRTGTILLVVGLALVLWAWGSWLYRTSVAHSESVAVRVEIDEGNADQEQAVRAAPLFLLVASLLMLVFLAGSFVLVRLGRRRRQLADRKRAAATPVEDIWARHKLPDAAAFDKDDTGSAFR